MENQVCDCPCHDGDIIHNEPCCRKCESCEKYIDILQWDKHQQLHEDAKKELAEYAKKFPEYQHLLASPEMIELLKVEYKCLNSEQRDALNGFMDTHLRATGQDKQDENGVN